ncbi:unnamed protein product [Adineta ricciae]|uniref:Diacylglycerol kinase n=1 Tax=Adineta ricciae TaxID=249248 RepID=A0A814QHN1_ADIRI|nr:unnamed protein product [Adineta ricciae]CAF1216033.1 unnamed protein product [Adineta ricciae]
MNEYDKNHQEISSESLESKLNQLNLSSSSFDVNSNDDDEEQIPVSIDSPTIPQPLNASHQTDCKSTSSSEFGVDWSNRACPTSHCWFPVDSNGSSTNISESNSNLKSKLLCCETCGLTVHSHRLTNSKVITSDFPSPCRPSFVDVNSNSSDYDKHFWCQENTLPTPCLICQRTSVTATLFAHGIDQLSSMSASDIANEFTSIFSSKPGNFMQKLSESSGGIVCLWCSRSYHHSCWERVTNKDDQVHCDYGIFRNIIVRPQWLTRSLQSPLGFRARLPDNLSSDSFPYTPVLFFINKRSGGQVGEKIYRELLRKFNPRQIFLLENNDTITRALDMYSALPNTRICVFGGDGTVGWILNRLAEIYPERKNPPVGICPLGTGNDLSRVLNWGGEYEAKQLVQTLINLPQSKVVTLDRWKVELEQFDMSRQNLSTNNDRGNDSPITRVFQTLFKQPPRFALEIHRDSYEQYHALPNSRFINYMSFGFDAAIALNFHDQRTRNPEKFSSPLKNKFMYLNESCKYLDEFTRANLWNLSSYIRLICDGQNLTNAMRDCHTLVILNISGYAAGANPWGNTGSTMSSDLFDRQDFGDRKIEIVGLTTAHMAAIHMGFRGNRIAQCNQVRIELCYPMTAQMDGEPFYLPASTAVNISHAGQVLVLSNDNK